MVWGKVRGGGGGRGGCVGRDGVDFVLFFWGGIKCYN